MKTARKKGRKRQKATTELLTAQSNLFLSMETIRNKSGGNSTAIEEALLSIAASLFVIARDVERRAQKEGF